MSDTKEALERDWKLFEKWAREYGLNPHERGGINQIAFDAYSAGLASAAERELELRDLLSPWDDMRAVEFDSNGNTVLRVSKEYWKRILAALRGEKKL